AVAAEFSFFLALPTLFGAGLLKLVKHRHDLHADAAAALGVGFAVAFVSAALVVEPFMAYVRTRRFRPFAIYRVCLGAVVVLAYALGAVAH
ncbi:MAG: undecaprenyl-diphosphate phosphatase, partial [Phycisphaerae bacterium]